MAEMTVKAMTNKCKVWIGVGLVVRKQKAQLGGSVQPWCSDDSKIES